MERALGTLERLRTTLVGSFDIMLGYMIGFLIFAIVQTAVILIFTIFALRIEYAGKLWEIGAILFLVVTVAVSLGIFISGFANNELQVVRFIPTVLAPRIFLSGVIIPVEQMPQLFEWLSVVLPLTYAVEALREIMLRGAALTTLWSNLLALAVYSIALLAAPVATLRRWGFIPPLPFMLSSTTPRSLGPICTALQPRSLSPPPGERYREGGPRSYLKACRSTSLPITHPPI